MQCRACLNPKPSRRNLTHGCLSIHPPRRQAIAPSVTHATTAHVKQPPLRECISVTPSELSMLSFYVGSLFTSWCEDPEYNYARVNFILVA